MIRTSPDPRARAGRAGFTLIELLVALLISGMLASVVFQLLGGNSEFVAAQSAREEVQQNARASLELIAGDLRAVPASGFREIEPNYVRFYMPRGWGVLCNQVDQNSTTAYVIFDTSLFPEEFEYGERHWGIALEQTNDPSMSPGAYSFAEQVTEVAGGNQCDALQPDQTAQHAVLGFRAIQAQELVDPAQFPGGIPTAIQPGTQVMVWEEIAYEVDESEGFPGLWLYRMTGYSGNEPNMQPMAGPLPSEESLRFTYLTDDGVTETNDPTQVRQVRIWLEAESRSRRLRDGEMKSQQTDTMTTEIILRNQ